MLSIGFAGSLFTGCGKESAGPVKATPRYDPTAQILGFLQDVQDSRNGVPKTGEGFSTDSAVWYVEAGLNYTLGNIGMAYNVSVVDSFTVPLVINDNISQAGAVYVAFETLVEQLAPLVTDEQHIILVDVVEPALGDAELLVAVTIGSDYSKAAPNTTYGIKDYYYYNGQNTPSTMCGCEPPPQLPRSVLCANIIIQNRINSANQILLQTGQILTDIETWQVWQFTNLPSRFLSVYDPLLLQAPYGDGYRDTKTFAWIQGAVPGATCLTPAEMSYWTGNATTGTWSAIQTIKSTYCPSKIFLSCSIVGETWMANGFIPSAPPPTTGQTFFHRCYFRYGRISYPGTGG